MSKKVFVCPKCKKESNFHMEYTLKKVKKSIFFKSDGTKIYEDIDAKEQGIASICCDTCGERIYVRCIDELFLDFGKDKE